MHWAPKQKNWSWIGISSKTLSIMAVFRGVLFLLWLKRSLVLCGLIQTEIQTKSSMSWRNWGCTSFPASSKSGDNWLYRLGSTLKASVIILEWWEKGTRPGTIRTWLLKCSPCLRCSHPSSMWNALLKVLRSRHWHRYMHPIVQAWCAVIIHYVAGDEWKLGLKTSVLGTFGVQGTYTFIGIQRWYMTNNPSVWFRWPDSICTNWKLLGMSAA